MARARKGRKAKSRRLSLKLGFAFLFLLLAFGFAGEWFVHHSRKWIDRRCETLPALLTAPLMYFGYPLADITDALSLTGRDVIYEYDTEAPSGSILFAGAPRRIAGPAPADIRVLDRGEFLIGWSDSLRHPVWCAYHVLREPRFESAKRPGFTMDHSLPRSPRPADYTNSGYDRGHMVPNYAIVTRYGEDVQKRTFMMSNIAPQRAALNRGVWRNIEHRIADLWTARYGEIWVVVGCISNAGAELPSSGIDVPSKYYQIIIAQEGLDIRILALLFDQEVGWNEWAAHGLTTVDEIEQLTGLDFNPDLPAFIQDPLEAELPSRLWPIRTRDALTLIADWFAD